MAGFSPKQQKILVRIGSQTRLIALLVLALVFSLMYWGFKQQKRQPNKLETSSGSTRFRIKEVEKGVENGIHLESGLIAAKGYKLVQYNCGGCHSLKLVTQNRNTADGWGETIKWMQETQNLWDLGSNENQIISYLAQNYGPVSQGRRANLVVEEWYELEN